ncbi:MAG: tyrosine-type recombinase/integrase [Hyphomicrobiales bacterium]|nr:tyrosine-type recombinase/integrase [Hyphomicrobiales bacterium]
MVRVNVKGVNTVTKRLADGTVKLYYYHRATGSRLEGEPGSPEFLQSYAAAERTLVARDQGTIAELIRGYSASPEFVKLADSTQREYRRMLRAIETEFGDMPLEAADDPRARGEFLEWRDKVAKRGAREADNQLSVLSAILSWGVERGKVHQNVVRGFKRLYHSDRSEKIWLSEHIRAFMASANRELQAALILALHTGQRQGDLLRLTWADYDGMQLALRQRKTGVPVVIPCTAALKRMLDGLPRRSPLILTTPTGRGWTTYHFRHRWADTAKKAGIEGLHFHDLRGTAVTMLSEADCTPQQIAAITGHSLKYVGQILDKYLARTNALAEQAIFKFENAKGTKFANQLQTGAFPIAKGGHK